MSYIIKDGTETHVVLYGVGRKKILLYRMEYTTMLYNIQHVA